MGKGGNLYGCSIETDGGEIETISHWVYYLNAFGRLRPST